MLSYGSVKVCRVIHDEDAVKYAGENSCFWVLDAFPVKQFVTNLIFILVLLVFSDNPLSGPYTFDLYLLFLLKKGSKSDSENFKPYFHIGFAYVLSKSLA